MKVLITGAAGFIGSALSLRLLDRGDEVVGIDNHNDYYDPALKEARLKRHLDHAAYTHVRGDLADRSLMESLFKEQQPQRVVNLAAQAGVRYSLENPLAYIDSNLVGFGHILEGCRHNEVEHLVYASSSSVYGANTKMPFSVHDNVDHPVSLYAATKKPMSSWRIPTAISMLCPQRVYVFLLCTVRGIGLIWHCKNSPALFCEGKLLMCITMVSTVEILLISTTLSKV